MHCKCQLSGAGMTFWESTFAVADKSGQVLVFQLFPVRIVWDCLLSGDVSSRNPAEYNAFTDIARTGIKLTPN